MRSTAKEVKEKIQAYILENITLEDYGKENTPSNLYEVFKSEYLTNSKDNRHEQFIFMDWLRGCPSAFNAEMYFDEVDKILNDWGLSTTGKSNTINFDWYLFLIYRELKQLLKIAAKKNKNKGL